MPDESTGFEPEPFTLAALAGQEHLRERLYAAQNLLVKRDAEIARLTAEVTELRRTIRVVNDTREREPGDDGSWLEDLAAASMRAMKAKYPDREQP